MTTEQLTKETEQTNQSSEKGEAEKVSTKEVQTSTKQTEPENKAYRSLQSSLDKLKAEITTLKQSKQSETRKLATDAEIKRWVESGEVESEEKARKFESVVEKYASERQDHLQEVEEHKTKVAEFDTTLKTSNATSLLITAILPEADDLLKESVETILKEADSPKAMKLMAEKLGAGLREKLIEALTSKEKEEVKRPDSGRTSTSGGNLSDGKFLKEFGDGTLPMTKENKARASKLLA